MMAEEDSETQQLTMTVSVQRTSKFSVLEPPPCLDVNSPENCASSGIIPRLEIPGYLTNDESSPSEQRSPEGPIVMVERTSKSSAHKPSKAADFVEQVAAMCSAMKVAIDIQGGEFHLAMTRDALLCKAASFFGLREEYGNNGISTRVDIVYHWTDATYIDSISQNGLLTSVERKERKICSKSNGARYGDGIYSCWNPFAEHARGDTCIILASLEGESEEIEPGQEAFSRGKTGKVFSDHPGKGYSILRSSKHCMPLIRFNKSAIDTNDDTATGNRVLRVWHALLDDFLHDRDIFGCKMLQRSPMCMRPFLRCRVHDEQSDVSSSEGVVKDVLSRFGDLLMKDQIKFREFLRFRRLQTPMALDGLRAGGTGGSSMCSDSAVVVDFDDDDSDRIVFHEKRAANCWSCATGVPRAGSKAIRKAIRKAISQAFCKAVTTIFVDNSSSEWIVYQAPETLVDPAASRHYTTVDDSASSSAPSSQMDCPICLSSLHNGSRVGYPKVCNHWFHVHCIESALENGRNCPMCRKLVAIPQGKMPYGSMVISRSRTDVCEGYYHVGAIIIDYNMHSGVQKAYHDNPGKAYPSTHRRAFLPDNIEGNQLLKRLKFAFRCGLTFTVGTSLTTGKTSQITWSSIHHKTSMTSSSGPHGYPDDGYFYNCNEELDALGVPSFEDCPDDDDDDDDKGDDNCRHSSTSYFPSGSCSIS